MSPADAAARSAPPSVARPMLGMAVAFALLLLAAAGLKSWRDLQTARQREAVIMDRVRSTEANVEQLQRRIANLQRDPVTLERAAREQLGMVKPGDVVIVLPEPKPAPVAPAPAPAPPQP